MGVYDFFKGTCPHCCKSIDDHPEYGKGGDIQTKYFISDPEECFRTFLPGNRVPFAPNTNLVIGRSCCCDTILKACFEADRLIEYAVVCGHEKFDYIQNEVRHSFYKRYIPQKDFEWFCHYQKTKDANLEEQIVREACHPRRVEFYLERGYSIDTICHA